jgi:Tol biopolymer transport system component
MGRSRLAVASVALASCIVAIWVLGGGTAKATFPGSSGLIAVQRSEDPDESSIWVLDWRSGAAHQLTKRGFAGEPAFSPNGRWIAFRSDASKYGRLNIWAIRIDGTGLHRLTVGYGELAAGSPAFSANGQWVAFSAEAPGGGREIERVALNGGRRRVLVPGTRQNSVGSPSYSPDGRHLAWVGGSEVLRGRAEPHIFIGNPHGHGVRRLALGDEPEFSPDGRSIVFVKAHRCGEGALGTEIDTISFEPRREWLVTASCGAELFGPTYSPDGDWIAYSRFSVSKEKSELAFAPVPGITPSYMPIDGLGTDLPVDQFPSWQPVP